MADVLHSLGWQQLLGGAYAQHLEVHAVTVQPAAQRGIAHTSCHCDLKLHLCFQSGLWFRVLALRKRLLRRRAYSLWDCAPLSYPSRGV